MKTDGRSLIAVAPHPDDFEIGAFVTTKSLMENGWRALLIVCSLGRPEQWDRRRAEQQEAARRGGYEVLFLDPPVSISSRDDLAAAESYVREKMSAILEEHQPELVISVSPHDLHHGHEVVGRAVVDALSDMVHRPVFWLYDVWASPHNPTLYLPFNQPRMDEALDVLRGFVGELSRNDYNDKLIGRSRESRCNVELVLGFGNEVSFDEPYCQLLTELVPYGDRWIFGTARRLQPDQPFGIGDETVEKRDATQWLLNPSGRALVAKR